MPGGPEFLILGVFWLLPALAIWSLVRRPSDRSVAAFAKVYEVPLTVGNVEQLRHYIQWTRRWRVGAAILAFVVASAVAAIRRDAIGNPWLPLVIGYSLGSVVGEILRPNERIPHEQRASLERRRVVDFVRPGFLGALAVVYVLTLVPAGWLLLTNPQRSWSDRTGLGEPLGVRPQDWFVLALIAVASGAVLLCWLGGRAIARAPFPADSRDRQAVRHAIRSAALLSMVGGATMVCGAIVNKLSWSVTDLTVGRSVLGQFVVAISWVGILAAMWGALLTLTSVPHFAPFAGALPPVPHPEQRADGA